jgi:hypothetical protein
MASLFCGKRPSASFQRTHGGAERGFGRDDRVFGDGEAGFTEHQFIAGDGAGVEAGLRDAEGLALAVERLAIEGELKLAAR